MFIKSSEKIVSTDAYKGRKAKAALQIRDDFVAFLKSINIDNFIYLDFLVPHHYYLDKSSPYTNYPSVVISSYIENGLYSVDPIMQLIEDTDREYLVPRDVITDIKKTRELTSSEKIYFQALKDIEFDTGITIKFQEPPCALGINSFTEDTEEIYLKNKEEIIKKFNQYRTELLNISIKKPRVILTEKERECLDWIAQGKTVWEISKIMDLSERSINLHINSFIKKIGAESRTHAVAIAIEQKIIKIK